VSLTLLDNTGNNAMAVDVKQIGAQVEKESVLINQIRSEIHKVIVGQEQLIDGLLFCRKKNATGKKKPC
jgi:hypothetical protein